MDIDKCLGMLYACNVHGGGQGSRWYRLARQLESRYFRPDVPGLKFYQKDQHGRVGYPMGHSSLRDRFLNYSEARGWAAHYVRMIRGPR